MVHLYQVDHLPICASNPYKMVIHYFYSFFFFKIASQIINEMLRDGTLHDHVKFLRKVHGERLKEGLIRPIKEELIPLGCSIQIIPRGGYFVWLRLPVPGNQLMQITRQYGIEVNVGLGPLFTVTQDASYYVRLCFANYDKETLQLGVQRLKEALILCLKRE